MNKAVKICLICAVCVLLAGVFFSVTPAGRSVWNTWMSGVQKADDATNYETVKTVEDTCRAMVASYNSDKLTYEQYKLSDSKNEKSWAEQAKMRANKTASSYNAYILRNTFVWKGNIPADISMELPVLQ